MYIHLLKFFSFNFLIINNFNLNKNLTTHLYRNINYKIINNLNPQKSFNNFNLKLNKHLFLTFKNDSLNYFFFKKIKKPYLMDFSFFKKNLFFFNFFYNYCFNKNNFIILDSNYSNIYPIYRHVYGYKFLSLYKTFFFIEPKYFILKNWLYFLFKFCEFNKINLIFIFDYEYYVNFYKNISDSNISTSAIIPNSYIDDYIDYPLYSFNINIITKILYSSYILYIYTLAFNYKNFLNQYKYMVYFYKYLNF